MDGFRRRVQLWDEEEGGQRLGVSGRIKWRLWMQEGVVKFMRERKRQWRGMSRAYDSFTP